MPILQKAMRLLNDIERQPKKKAVIGFDASIDSLVRPIKRMSHSGATEYFESIEEFGNFIASKKSLSCVIEISTVIEKPGGNMINLSHALGKLQLNVACIGSMGEEDVNCAFKTLSANCTPYSVVNPGRCTAIEFTDGKVMLGHMSEPNSMTFERIVQKIKAPVLQKLFGESDLIGFVNWSEICQSTKIWKSCFEEFIATTKPNKEKIILMDITDCSRMDSADILELIGVINGFKDYRRTVLSLNLNEAVTLAEALGCGKNTDNAAVLAKNIFNSVQTDIVVVHPLKGSYAVENDRCYYTEGFFVEKPEISTGGGDNYNAGLALGLLFNADIETAMFLANSLSSCYVQTGKSPNLNELICYIQARNKQAQEV